MTILNNIFLYAAIVVCVLALALNIAKYSGVKALTERTPEMKNNIYNILICVIAAAAVFIRIYKFGSVPGGMNQDGAMAAVDAKALADYATDRYGMWMPVHLTAWGYGQMSALLSYLMAPFVKIGGLSAFTARLPQLLVSLAGLVCLYLFIRDVFGKIPALIVAAFAAINPWHILQSRWALDCNLYPQFFMMGIYFLHKGINRRLHLIISMIMFGLCMYCYGISIYTMPVFLLAACVYLLVTKRIKIKDAVIALLVYLLVAWPFITTMVINFLKLDSIKTPFFTIPYFPNSVRSNDILFFSDNIWQQLIANFKQLMNVTLLQKPDLPWNAIDKFGTMYLFSMPFVITGIIALVKDYRKNAGAILALIFLLTGIWCGLTTNGVNVNRINIVYYPIIIMAGIGIYFVIKQIKYSHFPIAAAYVTAFVIFAVTYFTSYADMMDGYFFKNFNEAVTSVKDTDADKIYITADSQYEGSRNVSEILTLFCHETDAEYYQGKKTDADGKTFNEKYVFQSIKNIDIDPNEDAVYVVKADDLQYFDESKYDFESFGNYYTVKRK